ncbi:MAG: ABC transporter ATP-binding protein [Clostridia bacterium]|nr:ABC transporter ATP-binding protein [Clostridia bacterium]
MNMITGFIESSSGSIEINGFDVSKKAKYAKREIGYMPETTPLYNDLTPREFVSYMAELKGISSKTRKEETTKVLKQVNIEDVQNKLIRNLSRGYKQRVSLAGALIGDPKVLILDEPTVGLDPKQVMQIRELIKSLGKNHTVILSSHILSEVNQICEKVIIMNKGEIVAIDTPENLENNVKTENSLLVTIEETSENVEDIARKLPNVKSINLIRKLPDGTKQYSITPKGEIDIRKEVSEGFSKNNITIFELKKEDATLEEAFIKLIDKQKQKTTQEENKENEHKKQKDNKKGGKK